MFFFLLIFVSIYSLKKTVRLELYLHIFASLVETAWNKVFSRVKTHTVLQFEKQITFSHPVTSIVLRIFRYRQPSGKLLSNRFSTIVLPTFPVRVFM